MQVMLIGLQHHAQTLDLGVPVEGQPPSPRKLVHLPDQALDQRRGRLGAGAGIGFRQIVGRRWVEAIPVGEHRAGRPVEADAAAETKIAGARDQRRVEFDDLLGQVVRQPLVVAHAAPSFCFRARHLQ